MTQNAPAARRPTQSERTARTRSALLGAARELFAERGFAATGREDIAARAGVTRGALYHHFDSKQDIAVAVVKELDEELTRRVVAAARTGRTAYDRLRRSCRAYIDACAEPDVARIFADAPTILGPEECRSLNANSCAALLEPALVAVAAEGRDVPGDRATATSLILGMLNEG